MASGFYHVCDKCGKMHKTSTDGPQHAFIIVGTGVNFRAKETRMGTYEFCSLDCMTDYFRPGTKEAKAFSDNIDAIMQKQVSGPTIRGEKPDCHDK